MTASAILQLYAGEVLDSDQVASTSVCGCEAELEGAVGASAIFLYWVYFSVSGCKHLYMIK